MAISQTYYLNGPDLASSTAVYYDAAMTICAADGYYSDGSITRQQVSCSLLSVVPCASCGSACDGLVVNSSGSFGIYEINVVLGTATGGVRVRFDSYSSPDGIEVIYDGVVYNKLSSGSILLSGVDRVLQGISGLPTYIGTYTEGNLCGLCGNVFSTLPEYKYNGSSFVSTGNSYDVNVALGQCQLTDDNPGECFMVIPKTSTSPSVMKIRVFSPCNYGTFSVKVDCPINLTQILATDRSLEYVFACADTDRTFPWYIMGLAPLPTAPYIALGRQVFVDFYGQYPVADGWYGYDDPSLGAPLAFQTFKGVVIDVVPC
jgi:hypothetical protein